MNINKKMNKAMYVLYSVICSHSAFAVDNTVIVDHATSNRFNAIIECTHVETLPDGTKRCFVGHLGGNHSSNADHGGGIIPDNPNIDDEKCTIFTDAQKANLSYVFNYYPLNWCNVKTLLSNNSVSSNPDSEEAFESLNKLNDLTGIYLDASGCAYYDDISLEYFKNMTNLQSLRWSFAHTDFVDLSNMKSLINLNYTNYSSFNLSSNFIFNTSDPDDYNMIKTLLTIPNYKTGKLSGVSIIVDGNGNFTNQEIQDILSNKNIAIENPSQQQLKINTWNTIVGKAISSDEASSSNPNEDTNTLSVTLGANKTYAIYSLDENGFDNDGYDSFSSYIANSIYDLDSSKITSEPIDLLFSNILTSNPSYKYEILKTSNNTDKSYSINIPNVVDHVLVLDVTDIKSDSNAITERVTNKIKEKLNVNINLFESIPLTLNNFKINSWNKLDPNNKLTSKFEFVDYMFKTKIDPNKMYYVTFSSENVIVFNGQIKIFEKYNANYDKNIEKSFNYNPESNGTYSYIILKGKDLLDISFNSSPNGYIGVFEIPKEQLSKMEKSQFYDALSNGILSPELVFHDAPTTDVGVTNSFETIKPDRLNKFTKNVTLLPDNTYLIISGGNNGCDLNFNPRLPNQSDEFVFIPKPYKDWENSYIYYVTKGSVDPITIHGNIESSKAFSPTQFGIFKLDPNYNYHDSKNILNDYILKLYPDNFLNIPDSDVNSVVGKYSSSLYDLINNNYYPVMSKKFIYHIKAGKYYAFTTFVLNDTQYPSYDFKNFITEQNYARLRVRFNQQPITPFANSTSKSFTYGVFKAPKDENIMIESRFDNERDIKNMPIYAGLSEFDTQPTLEDIMNAAFYKNADFNKK